jgi:hydroxyethylthiazole kinase-like uncharacterized protein yjeF
MISIEDMKKLEESSGIAKISLMENAGRAVAKVIQEKIGIKNRRILIVTYHGNNGGDGFVIARRLANEAEVDVLFLGEESKLSKESSTNLKRIENNDSVQLLSPESVDFSDYDLIVDAILGSGINGDIRDPLATMITNLSKAKAFKVSIDVPSGINPDTGAKSNVYFEPDLLITLHDVKNGLKSYIDKTSVVDIGIKKLR